MGSSARKSEGDLRISKTDAALFGAFERLFAEVPYSDIRVSQICELAQVRTNTFYRHFRGKDHLFQEYLDNVHRGFLASLPDDKYRNDPVRYADCMCKQSFEFFKANEGMRRFMRTPNPPFENLALMTESMMPGLVKRIANYEKEKQAIVPGGPEQLALFYVVGLERLMRMWLAGNSALTDEEIRISTTEYLRRLCGA